MLISVKDLLVMLPLTGILGCRHCWRRHLFAIQKSFALFQIMSIGAMDFAPLLYVIGGVGRVSFPSDLSIVFRSSGILRSPSDLLVLQC
jgi:hypothetical protein